MLRNAGALRVGISRYKETPLHTMKILKRFTFGLLALMLGVLTSATVLEKIQGTPFVTRHIYGSPAFVLLWLLLSLSAVIYLLRRRPMRLATGLLHLALLVILGGAFVTWLTGQQGTLHLRLDKEPAHSYRDNSGEEQPFPFTVALESFDIEYYPGTRAPLDFVSRITITDGSQTHSETIAMNRIARYRGYRFYQSSYDSDGAGSRLSVSHDPWGIGITYTGYLLLLMAMAAQLTDRQGTFRRLFSAARFCWLPCSRLRRPRQGYPLPSRTNRPTSWGGSASTTTSASALSRHWPGTLR